MIDKLSGFWKTNKILFFILLPITVLSVIIKIYLAYNKSKAQEELKETQEIDDGLKKKQDEAERKADENEAKSDKLEEDIKKRNEDEDLDLDWNKKE